jgi:hypothetical protein
MTLSAHSVYYSLNDKYDQFITVQVFFKAPVEKPPGLISVLDANNLE